MVWAKGTVGELIFRPWVQRIEELGATLLTGKRCVREPLLGWLNGHYDPWGTTKCDVRVFAS